MPEPLDLPPGPLVQHLQAAHAVAESLGKAIQTLGGGHFPAALQEAHRG
ncbi:hypothetical protein Pam4_67 [Pseudanabaena phage Pam4]|nr:hypothetical protein Pam4_67 [Pseudanabaena phage Pam4]